MFDRRFDEPEEEIPTVKENLSAKSVDGIPSISELLNTLEEQISPPVAEQTEKSIEEETEEALLDDQEAGTEQPGSEQENESGEESDIQLNEIQHAVHSVETVFKAAQPVFTAEELEQTKANSFEEGRLQGIEEGREATWQEAMTSIEKQNSDLLAVIDLSLKEIISASHQAAETTFSTAVNFALAVCRKAVPALSEKNAVEEIKELLEKNFRFLKEDPLISLRLNPVLAERIKPVIAGIVKKEAYSGKVTVIRDDSLPVGDCRVEWKNGGLERKTEDVLKQAEELVKLYLQAAPEKPAEKIGEEKHG